MAYEFELPDLGDDVEEAGVVKWMIEEGDEVSEDDPVVEVETDRLIVELPSPVTGTVKERRAGVGETVGVGGVIATFEEDTEAEDKPEEGVEILGEDDGVGSSSAPNRVFASDSARLLARELGVDLSSVTGTGSGGMVTEDDVRYAAMERRDERTEPTAPEARQEFEEMIGEEDETVEDDKKPETTMFSDTGGESETDETDIFDDEDEATPETTVFGRGGAEESGADTEGDEDVSDTGEDLSEGVGVNGEKEVDITDAEELEEVDVETEVTETEGTAAEDMEADAEDVETEEEAKGDETDAEPTEATAPEEETRTTTYATHRDTADVERLVGMRQRLNDEAEASITYTAFFVKACAESVDVLDDIFGEEARVGVATDDGVHAVENPSEEFVGFAEGITESEGDNEADVTVVNLGAKGGEATTVTYGGTVTVAVGEIRRRPRVVKDEVVPRYTAPVSVTFDDTVALSEVTEFTDSLVRYLEEPDRLLV